MNNSITNSLSFIALVFAQVTVFNYVNLFGFINPLIYIAWVMFFPFRKNISFLLIFSFLLGLSVDFFSDSGGINAAATLFIAFIRLPLLRIILKKSDFDYLLFNLRTISFSKALSFISLLTVIHHFVVFTLAYFSFKEFTSVITNTLLTSFFTILLIILGIALFTKKR